MLYGSLEWDFAGLIVCIQVVLTSGSLKIKVLLCRPTFDVGEYTRSPSGTLFTFLGSGLIKRKKGTLIVIWLLGSLNPKP